MEKYSDTSANEEPHLIENCDNINPEVSNSNVTIVEDIQENDESLEMQIIDIESTIEFLMSPDKQLRSKGKIMWELINSKKNFGVLLTECYFRPNVPDHIQDYCLVLLKEYFSTPISDPERQKEQKNDAHELFNYYFEWLHDSDNTDTHQLVDLLTILIKLNSSKSHIYIEKIFMTISSNDPYQIFIMLDLLKNTIKKINFESDDIIIYNISHYINSLFKLLISSNSDYNLKVSILSTYKSYLLKLISDEENNKQMIIEFIVENVANYDSIVKEISLRYNDSDNYTIKLLQYINLLHENLEIEFILSKKQIVYSLLTKAYSDMALINEYLLNSNTSEELANLRNLCAAILYFLSSYINFGFVDGEHDYIIQMTNTTLYFLCLEQREILDNMSPICLSAFSSKHNSNLQSTSESSGNNDERDIDIVNIHNLRPVFLHYLNTFQSSIYEIILINMYSFIEQTIRISNCSNPYQLKLCEVCLWIIYKTCNFYFALPNVKNQLYHHIVELVISCIKFNDEGILHWQAIMAFISLCVFQPTNFDFVICEEIKNVLNNENTQFFVVIYAAEALQRIPGIMKFNQTVYNRYKGIIANLCDNMVKIYHKRENIEDRYKIHLIKTLNSLLISSEDFLLENLNSYFLFMFDLLKNNSKNYQLSETIVNSFVSISKYSCVGNVFIKFVYPHIINALKNDFSSDSFASNSSLCDIFQTIIILSNGELVDQEISYLYHIMYQLLENEDDETLLSVAKSTALCIHFYARLFNFRDFDDGTLTTYAIISLLYKMIRTPSLYSCPDFFELLRITVTNLPKIIESQDFFKILFYILLELQKNTDLDKKEYYLLSFCCFVSHYPIECINYLKRLPGLYYKLAIQDVLETWYLMHTFNIFSFNLFQYYSISSVFILFITWFNSNDSAFNNIIVDLSAHKNSNLTSMPVSCVLLSIFLYEIDKFHNYHRNTTYPDHFYIKYWNNDFKHPISISSLFSKIQEYIQNLPKPFIEVSIPYLKSNFLPTLNNIIQ